MPELIDKDYFKNMLLAWGKELSENPNAESDIQIDMIRQFYNAVEDFPTIEAEPVRHAHWETWGFVFHGIEWKRCSACGKCADVSYYGILDGEIKMSTPALCGGCGAQMQTEPPESEVQDDA